MRKSTLLLLFFWMSFFQMLIQEWIPVFSFFDECITIWALYMIIVKPWKNPLFKRMLILIFCMATIGVICNFHYGIQTQWSPLFTDIGNCFKVFITYIGSSLYFRTFPEKESNRFIFLCGKSLIFMIYVMAVMAVLNLFIDIGMHQDIRYGIPSFAFLFGGGAKFLMTFYLVVPMTLLYMSTGKVKNTTQIILLLSVVYGLTMRSRAFVYVTILCFLFFYLIHSNKKFQLTWKNIIIFLFIALLICYDQIEFYINMDNGQTARNALLVNGFEIMKDLFPFGYGFGTYGTDVAARYYSKLYDLFGMSNIYGMTRDDSAFARDCYWPAIMGQFGFIGLITFGICIYFMFRDIFRVSTDKYMKMTAVVISSSLILASTADSSFFHFITVCCMFFLAFIFHRKRKTLA